MNKRLGFAIAAYVAVWATVAGGIIYGTVRAGYSTWVGVASAFLLFLFVNGSLAYTARARQFRLEGKEPPPYFQFLFFPQGFPTLKAEAPKVGHFVVGIAAALTGLFFVFCGVALAFDAEWSRISQPILAASLCVILAGMGALFLYFAWRLFSTERIARPVLVTTVILYAVAVLVCTIRVVGYADADWLLPLLALTLPWSLISVPFVWSLGHGASLWFFWSVYLAGGAANALLLLRLSRKGN